MVFGARIRGGRHITGPYVDHLHLRPHAHPHYPGRLPVAGVVCFDLREVGAGGRHEGPQLSPDPGHQPDGGHDFKLIILFDNR